ncbi:hypothetical protein [Microbacterium sp. che218]|uniref:hypothetical protein n=1 Tax=Microbacterium sp. che218 TaxID=3140649 RepID=UPI0033680C33
MTNTDGLVSGPPTGLAAGVIRGWGYGTLNGYGDVEDVPFGRGFIPEFFTVQIEPDEGPNGVDDDYWSLDLYFQVEPGADTSELRIARCNQRDLSSTLDLVREKWALTIWRNWAHLTLLLGGEARARVSSSGEKDAALDILSTTRPRKRKRTSITEAHLEAVAQVYLAAPQKPTLAVERHFITNHSTAARWVGLARKAGLLPPVDRRSEG